jgi:hypothetical protein
MNGVESACQVLTNIGIVRQIIGLDNKMNVAKLLKILAFAHSSS